MGTATGGAVSVAGAGASVGRSTPSFAGDPVSRGEFVMVIVMVLPCGVKRIEGGAGLRGFMRVGCTHNHDQGVR